MAMLETMSHPHGNSHCPPISYTSRRPKTPNYTMPRLTIPFLAPFGGRRRRFALGVDPPDDTNQVPDRPDHPDRSDRPGRRRPFSTLMRKLANLKAGDSIRPASSKRNNVKLSSKKGPAHNNNSQNNNPYPLSGRLRSNTEPHQRDHSFSSRSTRVSSATSLRPGTSLRSSADERPPPTAGTTSMAPTVSTDHETSRSVTAPSHGTSSVTGTSRTATGGVESRRGGDSTFSSPAPSVRSLTTTLTTIQSMPLNGTTNGNASHNTAYVNGNANNNATNNANASGHHSQPPNSQVIHFNQPFPTASPASAIPSHLTPSSSTPGYPTTYSTATANNLLTDNASILTLASSSRRRRRRSLDTDASVRALAPSSLFGGSRESLPLSVLSANIDAGGPTTPGLHRSATGVGNERTSIYSTTGILASERNSLYAKPGFSGPASGGGGGGGGASSGSGPGDGASIRSGLLGHGRTESVSGSIGGIAVSPLASPMETAEKEAAQGREKDRSSGKDSGRESEEKTENGRAEPS